MQLRVTIKDIAALAEVSPGTVDRVIHQRGNVSKKARERIERAMRELDYEPNIIASTLAYNRTLRIVALLPDHRSDAYWEQPYSGIEKAAIAVRHYGVQVEWVFFDLNRPTDFLEKAQSVLASEPESLLFAPIFLEESERVLEQCANNGVPAVLINTNLENQPALCYVGQDSYQSGVLAGKLLHLGLQSGDEIALLNLDKEIEHAQHLIEKERGLRDYFSTHPPHIQVIRCDLEAFEDVDQLRLNLMDLLHEHPKITGMFVTNSRAYRVIEALERTQYSNLRIVGFDLIPANLHYLSADRIAFLINQNPVQQGYQAIMNIVNHLIFKKPVERIQYLPLDIVVAENASYYMAKRFY